jgi:hypothetical protein
VLVATQLEIPEADIRQAMGDYTDEDCLPTGNKQALAGR